MRVIERTAEEHKSMFFETTNLPVRITEEGIYGSCFDVDIQGVPFEGVRIAMAGRHQIDNAVAAMCALSIMEERGDVRVSRRALYAGLAAAMNSREEWKSLQKKRARLRESTERIILTELKL